MYLIEPRLDMLAKLPRTNVPMPQKQIRMKGNTGIHTGHQSRNLGRHK